MRVLALLLLLRSIELSVIQLLTDNSIVNGITHSDLNLNLSYYFKVLLSNQKQEVNMEVSNLNNFSVVKCMDVCQECKYDKNNGYKVYKSNSVNINQCENKFFDDDVCVDNILFNSNGFYINEFLLFSDFYSFHNIICSKDNNITTSNNTDGFINLNNLVDDLVYIKKSESDSDLSKIISICLGNVNSFINLGYDYINLNKGIESYSITNNIINEISFSINNVSIAILLEVTIDLRSTYSYLNKTIYSTLLTEIKKFCFEEGNCVKGKLIDSYLKYSIDEECLEIDDIEMFINTSPVIKYNIKETYYNWSPKDYFYIRKINSQYLACLTIKPTDSEKQVLGISWMKNKEIIFNYSNNSLSITESNCFNDNINLNYPDISTLKSLPVVKPATASYYSYVNYNNDYSSKKSNQIIEQKNDCDYHYSSNELLAFLILILLLILCLISGYIFIKCKRGERVFFFKDHDVKPDVFKPVEAI